MKSRSESLIRLKKFQVDEKRRQVTQIEMMVADFERMAAELDQQIEIEQRVNALQYVIGVGFAFPRHMPLGDTGGPAVADCRLFALADEFA